MTYSTLRKEIMDAAYRVSSKEDNERKEGKLLYSRFYDPTTSWHNHVFLNSLFSIFPHDINEDHELKYVIERKFIRHDGKRHRDLFWKFHFTTTKIITKHNYRREIIDIRSPIVWAKSKAIHTQTKSLITFLHDLAMSKILSRKAYSRVEGTRLTTFSP